MSGLWETVVLSSAIATTVAVIVGLILAEIRDAHSR